MDILHVEIEELKEKNKNLDNKCQHLQSMLEETRLMAVEDGRSFNHEFYSIKQKNDKMRSLLVE